MQHKKTTPKPSSKLLRYTSYKASVQRHLYLVTFATLLTFLAIFQRDFFFSATVWAESYTEYLNKILEGDWQDVIASSWEGYVTVLPSFFAKLYVAAHRPLGLIDFYYHYVTILFAVGSLAFLAAPIHRALIKSDITRVLLALALLMTLSHLSSFSFINVWYIGFVPIIFLALNPARLGKAQQVLYVFYAILIAFTKPSIILAPFVAYRAIKTKEYLSNGLILLATFWQTYLLFYATKNGTRNVASDLQTILEVLYAGSGVVVLKLLSIEPTHLLVVLANIIIVGMFALLYRYHGWKFATVLLCGYLFSIYSNLLAPGTGFILQLDVIYNEQYKLQREILTRAIIILIVFLSVGHVIELVRKMGRYSKYVVLLLIAIFVLCAVRLYHPIDTVSSAVYIDASSFRQSLNNREAVCMPIVPTPTWSAGTNWYFQYKGGCSPKNFDKKPNYASFKTSLAKPVDLHVEGLAGHSIKSLMLLVKNPNDRPSQVVLKDKTSGITMTAFVKPGSLDNLRFVAFNLAGYPEKESYDFELSSLDAPLLLGTFKDTDTPTYYSYYMGSPAP